MNGLNNLGWKSERVTIKLDCSFDCTPSRNGLPPGVFLVRHDGTVPATLVMACVSDEQAEWLANSFNKDLQMAVETFGHRPRPIDVTRGACPWCEQSLALVAKCCYCGRL
jgi:hypothetical protein